MFSSSNSRPRILALPITVLVLVATLLLPAIPQSSSLHFLRPRYHVHIANELTKNERLTVNCACTDAPQPTTYVDVGGEYEWAFRVHIFRLTQWTCYLTNSDNNRHAYFVAYEEETPNIGRNVYWAAKEDGVYFRIEGKADHLDWPWEIGR
ncbi:hypothetical protein LINPERPRIM_LOCUS26865 [Linum perenne]